MPGSLVTAELPGDSYPIDGSDRISRAHSTCGAAPVFHYHRFAATFLTCVLFPFIDCSYLIITLILFLRIYSHNLPVIHHRNRQYRQQRQHQIIAALKGYLI